MRSGHQGFWREEVNLREKCRSDLRYILKSCSLPRFNAINLFSSLEQAEIAIIGVIVLIQRNDWYHCLAVLSHESKLSLRA